MIKIEVVETYDKDLVKYVIIISRSQGKWVLCKHKERDTYEFPAGHIEDGESILEAAKRELYEETGAINYTIRQMFAFTSNQVNNGRCQPDGYFSVVYYSEITEFSRLPDFEMEKIELFDELPDNLTYSNVHPKLVDIVLEKILE